MILDGYACKECGAAATVLDGTITRSCEHTGTVLASMKATAYGEGGASDRGNAAQRLIARVLAQIKEWRA